jgi:hypothetical protein
MSPSFEKQMQKPISDTFWNQSTVSHLLIDTRLHRFQEAWGLPNTCNGGMVTQVP